MREPSNEPTRVPRRRVLIAEDEALIRLDLAEMLTEAGYEVVAQAADGEQAVALTLEHRPDLVVMDVKMPRLDGIAAAAQIAKERVAPVVMLTAFSQRELVERARDAGAMAYLVKPFTITDLVPAIEVAMSRFARARSPRSRDPGPPGAVGRTQDHRPRQVDVAGSTRPDRAGGVQLDSAHRDGPAALDARRRPAGDRARGRVRNRTIDHDSVTNRLRIASFGRGYHI